MLTQIYEVASPEEAKTIAAIGIDHIGVLVGDGQFPREVPLAVAAHVASAISAPSLFTALFLNANIAMIEAWARELAPAILHLGASPELLPPENVAVLKAKLTGTRIMRSIPIAGEECLAIARSYEEIADFLLLDSYRPHDKQIGALGVTHDWTISRRVVEAVRIPVILAGGLGPDNAADAIRAVRPAGVDSKTRTDQEFSHAKDLGRVRRFHEAARAV